MGWHFFVAYELRAFDWMGLSKRASGPVFALFFAALHSCYTSNNCFRPVIASSQLN